MVFSDLDTALNFPEFLAIFLTIFVLAIVFRLLHKRRFNIINERKLPNHILYFKNNSIKVVEDQLQEAGGHKAANDQNQTKPARQYIDKSNFKIKQFLPPEIAPYGNKLISQPFTSIDADSVKIKDNLPPLPVDETTEEVAEPMAPESSKLFKDIQAAAEKLCDETKKADKERKELERKKREEEKKKAEEEAQRMAQLEAEASAAAEKKTTGLGKGGLGKQLGLSKAGTGLGGGSSLSGNSGSLKLSLKKDGGTKPAEEAKKDEPAEEKKEDDSK